MSTFWSLAFARGMQDDIERYLKDGWEPFASYTFSDPQGSIHTFVMLRRPALNAAEAKVDSGTS